MMLLSLLTALFNFLLVFVFLVKNKSLKSTQVYTTLENYKLQLKN